MKFPNRKTKLKTNKHDNMVFGEFTSNKYRKDCL